MNNRKLEKYARLKKQISEYLVSTSDIWARLATIEAVLHNKMSVYFWTGVYVLIDGELIVRSYQGPVACQKLNKNVGVCWEAINSEKTVIVDNVDDFPGHIACNSASKSEIVIPIRDLSGSIIGCFDVDSREIASFDNDDAKGIQSILSLIYSVPFENS